MLSRSVLPVMIMIVFWMKTELVLLSVPKL